MTGRAVPSSPAPLARSFFAAGLAVVFLWTLALSISPELHARVHADSGQSGHSCAATLIASGNYEHPVPGPLFVAATRIAWRSHVPALTPLWVESLFLKASVLEHAPPLSS